MFRTAYYGHIVFFVIFIKRQDCPHDTKRRVIDTLFRNKSVLHRFYKTFAKILCPHHLHILSAVGSFHRIQNAPAEIRHYKSVKIPFFFQHLGEQIFMMSALHAIIAVIRAHHTCSSGIDTVFKMRQIYFLLRSLVAGHATFETCIFHIVKCIVLDTCHNIFILHTFDKRRAHFSDLIGLLSVRLLTTSPSRIVRQVDTHACKQISAECTHFTSDTISDFLFQFR